MNSQSTNSQIRNWLLLKSLCINYLLLDVLWINSFTTILSCSASEVDDIHWKHFLLSNNQRERISMNPFRNLSLTRFTWRVLTRFLKGPVLFVAWPGFPSCRQAIPPPSGAQFRKPKIPTRKFQAKDPKPKIQSQSSQARVAILFLSEPKFPRENSRKRQIPN